MLRPTDLAEGEYYHLYSRGVDKRSIFLDEHDRKHFIKLLYVANSKKAFVFREVKNTTLDQIDRGEPLVSIGAYVLMDNHFHILVKEINTGGISLFMKKLLTGYSSYFNKRHGRSGTLFQSRYKYQHIARDEHLKYLFAYIHLNPVKKIEPKWQEVGIKNLREVKTFLNAFTYSSFHDYIGPTYVSSRIEKVILTKKDFPGYFIKQHEFKDFLNDGLTLKQEAIT